MSSSFTVGQPINLAGSALIQNAFAQLKSQISNKQWENRQAMPPTAPIAAGSLWASAYNQMWGDGPPWPEHLYFSVLNNEISMLPSGDAIRDLGSVPFVIDAQGNISIAPRQLSGAEKTFLSRTNPMPNNAAVMQRLKLASGAFSSTPWSIKPPFYVRMKCRVPSMQGQWPAFWFVAANGSWPPEIDVFECLNNAGNNFQYTTSVHTNDTAWPAKVTAAGGTTYVGGNSATQALPTSGIDFVNTFHEYGAAVYQDNIAITFDGKIIKAWPTPADCNIPWIIMVDNTVGGPGDWAGTPPDLNAALQPLVISSLDVMSMPVNYTQAPPSSGITLTAAQLTAITNSLNAITNANTTISNNVASIKSILKIT